MIHPGCYSYFISINIQARFIPRIYVSIFTPLKLRALPILPAVQLAPLIVPWLLLPEESEAFFPVFSSNFQEATGLEFPILAGEILRVPFFLISETDIPFGSLIFTLDRLIQEILDELIAVALIIMNVPDLETLLWPRMTLKIFATRPVELFITPL